MYSKGNDAIRQLQVAEQCVELAAAIELLEKQLEELEQRLSMTVLRNEDAVKETDSMMKADTLVPHAENLRQRVWHVQKLQSIVMSILQRIEI